MPNYKTTATRTNRLRNAVHMCFLTLVACSTCTAFAVDTNQSVRVDTYLKSLQYQGVKLVDNEYYRPLVQARLGNGRDVVALVSTGETISTVNSSDAKGFKTLGQLGVDVEDGVLGRLTDTNRILVEKMVIGTAEFYNHTARIVKQKGLYKVMPFTATLGCDFLVRNYCLIDFGGRSLYFRAKKPSQEVSEALSQSLRNSGFYESAIPDDWPLTVESQINGLTIHLAINTGSPMSLLQEDKVKNLRLPIVKRESAFAFPADASALLVDDQGGARTLRMTTISNMEIGGSHWTNVHFGLVPAIHVRTNLNNRLHGDLGPDFLAGNRAILDFSTLKLWLLPIK